MIMKHLLTRNYQLTIDFLRKYTKTNSRIIKSISNKRTLSTAAESFKEGQTLSGFVIQEVRDVQELQLKAVRLAHTRTGAQYLHIIRNDSNNVFCVGFKTPPASSTGVTHILEHTVLCGSSKYPCRDPFFKMLNRSLSTFMNAFTGSDYTMYPFSTQHPVDFRNLMSIYLDAAFRPNLKELDFLQEGWRLEHQDLTDKSSPIIFKGVVFNEMKGVFADPQMFFARKLLNTLLPSGTYGHESGGDPLCIPELTWEQLKHFHAQHYHPSNSRFFTYGNLPLADHLAFINEEYLKDFQKLDINLDVPNEPKWKEARKLHVYCGKEPMASSEKTASVAVAYMLTNVADYFESLVLSIISELLISGPNAPFYKSLLEPQIGSSFSPVAGFDNQTRNTTFAIGLQGMSENDIDKAVSVIEETFRTVVEEGFLKERIEAVLHHIELNVKHQTRNFGLGLAMSMNPLWNHGGDIINALEINQCIARLRNLLQENPKFLQEKVNDYFIKNKHKLILSMSPEDNYETKLQELEENLLKKFTSNLSDTDREKVWALGSTLKEKQEMTEDVSCLPTLKVSDIQRNISPTNVTVLKLDGNVPLHLCQQPTNEVTYFGAVIDTKQVPENLLKLVPLLANILTKMGAGPLDFREFAHKADLVSGGLHAGVHVVDHPIDPSLYEQGITLSSHCLAKNFSSMLELWQLIFNELRFEDLDRFSTLVKMIATELSNSLVHGGHSYAMSHAASSMSYSSHISDCWGGFRFLQEMKSISELTDLTETLIDLKKLAKILLDDCHMRLSLHLSPDSSDDSIKQIEKFVNNLNGTSSYKNAFGSISSNFTPHTCRTHHVFPFPINFVSKSYTGVPYAHPDSGPLRLLARLMFRYLHQEIREKGGAYGGGASYQPGQTFKFYSYRDPESIRTLKTFDNAVGWVLDAKFSNQDVDEAKLGIFQSIDTPIPPGSKGMRSFLYHLSHDDFSHHRCSILDTDATDVIRVARLYLREARIDGACLIGPQNEHLEKDHFWNAVQH